MEGFGYMFLFCLIYAVVAFNVAPFIYSDTFGHYIRCEMKHYVYRDKDREDEIRLICKVDFEDIKEPVNPWLEWWHLAKHKPNTDEWSFENEEVERLWNVIKKEGDKK